MSTVEQNIHGHAARVAATRNSNFRLASAWLPALLGVAAICCESTRVMGADHTMSWLTRLCSPLVHLQYANVSELNHVLRKCGHFVGYGTLGLVLMQGWLSLLMVRLHQTWTKLRLIAGSLAVLSVSLVASMDEIHQSFLPNRTACVSDVLLDTGGALLLISIASLLLNARRKRMLTRLLQVRMIRQWKEETCLFRSALLDTPR